MNKRIEVLLHLAAWAILFLFPLNFYSRGHDITLLQYIMICLSPIIIMMVFYANYFWLAPRYLVTGQSRRFWLINIGLVTVLGIGLHFWLVYVRNVYEGAPGKCNEPTFIDNVLFISRHIFNFSVATGIATTIVLSKRWQHAEQARKDAEAARMEAELSNLRSQVNPHFLLNTLNNIYALTVFDTAKAQEAIMMLSRMLRHILYDYNLPSVPLKDEISFIENYVKLMQLRLRESVDVRFNVDCTHTDAPIAPMLIISLVENAFKHGVSPTEPSFIHINIAADERRRICDISNSNHPKPASDNSGHGIGLAQVQHRLDLAYPGQYTWIKGVSDNGKVYRSCITIELKGDRGIKGVVKGVKRS